MNQEITLLHKQTAARLNKSETDNKEEPHETSKLYNIRICLYNIRICLYILYKIRICLAALRHNMQRELCSKLQVKVI